MPQTLETVSRYLCSRRFSFAEIVVVDDGSSDGTGRVAREFAAEHGSVRVLRNPGNCGKGYAVRNGMLAARGEWRLFSDADLSTPIDELEKLWEGCLRAEAQIAIGSRALNRSLIGVRQPRFRETAGSFFNAVMRAVTGLPFRDTQCGFKLFSAEAADSCFSRQLLQRFGFDVEILCIAQLKGFRVEEVPVRWNHAEGTKVGMLNGAQSFLDLLTIRRNRREGKYE